MPNQNPLRNVLSAILFCLLPSLAAAQSTAGNIAGDAKAGDTIVVKGESNGFKRELKVEADGQFKIRRVPIGKYDIVFVHQDGKMETTQGIVVRPDGTTRVSSTGEIRQDKDGFSQTDQY